MRSVSYLYVRVGYIRECLCIHTTFDLAFRLQLGIILSVDWVEGMEYLPQLPWTIRFDAATSTCRALSNRLWAVRDVLRPGALSQPAHCPHTRRAFAYWFQLCWMHGRHRWLKIELKIENRLSIIMGIISFSFRWHSSQDSTTNCCVWQ